MTRASKATEADEPLSRQSLKSAVWYTVAKIAQEEEVTLPFGASEQFVASLAEVVFQQTLSLGKDLELFAKHAGRMTINVDDVKLAARRNEPLYDSLCTSAQQHGLALADLKADQSKPKKAPRASSSSKVLAGASTSAAEKEKKKDSAGTKEKEGKKKSVTGDRKGKGKAKAVVESEGSGSDEEGGGGGFVKASALKGKSKGKKRAVESESEEEVNSRSESEEDGRGKKRGGGKAKKRKSEE
ncbi:hypothetical protein JCM8547_001040 [Rhodosporidiobolus lusitaniae]